jgi:hypothetical protein
MIIAMNNLYESPMFPHYGKFNDYLYLFNDSTAVNTCILSSVHLRLLENIFYQATMLFFRCRLLNVAIGRLFSSIYCFLCFNFNHAVLYAQSVLSFIRVPLSSLSINLSFNYFNSS